MENTSKHSSIAFLLLPKLDWVKTHVSWGALFIWGLAVTHTLVEYACVSILITFFTDPTQTEQDIVKAAIAVNLQDGLTYMSVILLSHISDAYIGLFHAVLLSTASFSIGLMLLYFCSVEIIGRENHLLIFFFAAVVIAVGRSGRDPVLQTFLADQLIREHGENQNSHNPGRPREEENDQIEVRKNIWLGSARFAGAIIGLFGFLGVKWEIVFLVSMILMVSTGLLFCSGFLCYNRRGPTGSPLTPVFRVLKAAIRKHSCDYPNTPSKFYWGNHRQSRRFYHTRTDGRITLDPQSSPLFRWVDKAAIVEQENLLMNSNQETAGKLCTVQEVRHVKGLLSLTFIWVTSLGFSLVLACGTTLFNEQGDQMEGLFINGKKVRLTLFFVLKTFVRDIVILTFWSSKRLRTQGVALVRIGIGMVCAVICGIVAWLVEVRRKDVNNKMSVVWMCPQYFLLGLVEALSQNGVEKFFENNEDKFLSNFGKLFSAFVLGIGRFISMFCVLVSMSWFKDFEQGNSHLEWYFVTLAGVNFVFFCIYVYSAYTYSVTKSVPPKPEDLEIDTAMQESSGSNVELVKNTHQNHLVYGQKIIKPRD